MNMGTMLTAEEYKELNELRRYKAQREADDVRLRDAANRIGKVSEAIRQLIDERKRSLQPDGGGR